MTPVTDPALLARLEGGDGLTPVTDPDLLAQLNAEPDRNRLAETALGALRGAQGIGNTILDVASLPLKAFGGESNLASLISGQKQQTLYDQFHDWRHGGQDQLDRENAGSNFYTGGKLAAEIAGTAGAGGMLAGGLRAVPLVAKAAPGLLSAIETGGFAGGKLATRAAGGAIAGTAQNALVDPQSALTGAEIGGALPVVGKVGGLLGSKVAKAMGAGKAAANPQTLQVARDAAAAGYVIPPSDVQPQGLLMEALGGLSGKIKTAQVASARNQEVTNKLLRGDLGIGGDGPITAADFSAAKQPHFDAYEKARAISPEANEAVDLWRKANFEAGRQTKYYARSLDPAAQDAAQAAKDEAGQWAAFLESEAQKAGKPELFKELAAARISLAKIGSIQSTVNKTTGDVAAPKLAGLLDKGVPLSDGSLAVAKTAQAFPKAMQLLKESPKALSPLDYVLPLAGLPHTSGLSLLGLAARPAARKLLLSKVAQARAMRDLTSASSGPNALGLLGYRLAPELGLLDPGQ